MIERRYIELTGDKDLETRVQNEDGENKRYVIGYASLKGSSTKITERINGSIRTFTETISPTAFNDADISMVYHLLEHDRNRPVGKTGANTTVQITDRGLFYRTEIPVDRATTEQLDLLKNVEQGIIRGASFAFKIGQGGEKWERRNGELYRTIENISKVVDITSTIEGAYDDAFTFTRSLDETQIQEITTEPVIEPVIEEPKTANELERDIAEIEFLKLKAKQF